MSLSNLRKTVDVDNFVHSCAFNNEMAGSELLQDEESQKYTAVNDNRKLYRSGSKSEAWLMLKSDKDDAYNRLLREENPNSKINYNLSGICLDMFDNGRKHLTMDYYRSSQSRSLPSRDDENNIVVSSSSRNLILPHQQDSMAPLKRKRITFRLKEQHKLMAKRGRGSAADACILNRYGSLDLYCRWSMSRRSAAHSVDSHRRNDNESDDFNADSTEKICNLGQQILHNAVKRPNHHHRSSTHASSAPIKFLGIQNENNASIENVAFNIIDSLILSKSPMVVINLVRMHGCRNILLHASREGNTYVIEILARAGANFNLHDDDGSTPLIFASDAGQLESARVLLDNGANVDAKDRLGRSALTYAIYRGHQEVVKLLLHYDADSKSCDVDGCTPLMYGAARGSTECCKLLLDTEDVDPDASNKDGFTALIYALECGHVETGRMLINRGSRADSRSTNQSTCLHWAATCGQVESCRLLLDINADIDATNARGITPLMYSTARGQEHTSKLLIEHGANVHAQDSEGSTPLMYACYRGFSGIALMLLEAGANVEATNLRGATPLMYATARGQIDTAFTLLRWVEERSGQAETFAGIKETRNRLVRTKDCKGFTACHWAKQGGFLDTVKLLDIASTGLPILWTRKNAYQFPDSFKKVVQTLLLTFRKSNLSADLIDKIIEQLALTLWKSF